jgi:hypothetical protein
MTLKSSLESRLDLMLGETTPDSTVPGIEPTDVGDNETIQVAGPISAITEMLTKGGKAYKAGQDARAAKALNSASPSIPTAIPPGVAGAPSVPPMPTAAPVAKPKVKAQPKTAAELQQLPVQLENVEQTLTAAPPAPGTAVPKPLVNLDRIDGPEDFKQVVDALAQSSGVKVEKVTFEELIADAKAKGFSRDVLADLESMKQQYAEMPTDVVRSRLALAKNAKDFEQLAIDAYTKGLTPENQAQLLRSLSIHNSILDTYIGMRTAGAQATAAGRIDVSPAMAQDILNGKNVKIPGVNDAEMKAMLADPQIPENLKILVDKFVTLSDDAAKEGLINKVSKLGIIPDLWDRTYKNGLLSGLGTHITNLSSNVTFLASSVATRALAEGIGTAKRAVGLNGEIELGESAAMLAGIVHSFREGFGLSWEALKTGTTREMREGMDIMSDAGKKLEGQNQIFDSRNYGFENETLVKGINAYANFVTLLGGRPIMAMDEMFKTMGYRAELYAQSFRSSQQAKRAAIESGKTADEAEQIGLTKMGEILGNPPKEIDEAATDFSQMITFSRKLTGGSAQFQKLAQDHLIGRIIMPFIKTPVWVASESMQHSPFAFASKQWQTDVLAGGAKRELAIAKMGIGSMIMIGAGSYVADGRITGGGPGNTNLRNEYLASGWKPYSFVFQKDEWDQEFADYLKTMRIDPSISKDGKLYVPFRGIEPIGGPLAMIADAVEYARYEDDEDASAQVLLGAGWGLYNYVGQMPFLQGISSLAGAFSQSIPNPKAAFKSAIDGIASSAAQYAVEGSPLGIFSGSRSMIERGIDPDKRNTSASPSLDTGIKGFYEGLNKSIAKTPILSEDLPQQYDYLGEKMNDVDPSSPWLAGMSGVRFSESKQRPADKVIINLGIPLKKPDINLRAAGVSIKLEPEEYEFMMRKLGTITDSNGNRLKDAIWTTYISPGFTDNDLNVKQDNIKDVYESFTKAAQNELLMNSKFSGAIQTRIERAQNRLPRLGNYAK